MKAPSRCEHFSVLADLPGLRQRLAYEERTGKANLAGTIADAVTGKPVIGATITLYKAGSADNLLPTAKSDEEGKFEFSDAASGKYKFGVSHEGYIEETVDFQFWITRQNLTRVGRISLNPKNIQLNWRRPRDHDSTRKLTVFQYRPLSLSHRDKLDRA